jgi:hypothetical protein
MIEDGYESLALARAVKTDRFSLRPAQDANRKLAACIFLSETSTRTYHVFNSEGA